MLDSAKLKAKFDGFKKKVEEQKVAQQSFADDRFIDFQAGKTYRFRMIYDTTNEKREGPFISKWVHSTKDENGKRVSAVCPKTDNPKSYFKQCPVCQNNNKLYNSGSKSDMDLYDIHKPKFHGFAPVYVVSDPTNPDNNGHIKLIHFSVLAKEVFDWEIFGLAKRVKNTSEDKADKDEKTEKEPQLANADAIGSDAFALTGGYDLVVVVTKKPTSVWNDFKFSFARKQTNIDANVEALEKELTDIKFDSLEVHYNAEDIKKYYESYVMRQTTNKVDMPNQRSTSGNVSTPTSEEIMDQMLDSDDDDAIDVPSKSVDDQVIPHLPPVAAPPKATEVADDDIDDLLKDLK